jgi:SAM-dependent methyltransferase
MTGPGRVWLLGADASGDVALEGDSGELVLAVLAHARVPTSRDALAKAVLDEAGGNASGRRVVDDAIALLVRVGALVEARRALEPPRAGPAGRVVVAITGAVGALYVPRLVQGLVRTGHDVRVVMTRSARRFVAPRGFEALTHHAVVGGLWDGTPAQPAPHVELARWADVVVVSPCTATTLGRIASGDCSEIVSAVATTTRAPVLLVPSMNVAMWRAPRVEENVRALREAGFFVALPGRGHEVADAPDERVGREGAAMPVAFVSRWIDLLLRSAREDAPRLASRAEWDVEHEHLVAPREDGPVDPTLARFLDGLAPAPARVLDVGTGRGDAARAAARLGHAVVATDFSAVAIARARAVDPSLPVTWLVDDATDSGLHATFDLCIDRGCLGCVPVARRARYVAQVASWIRPRGTWFLLVHQGPPAPLRAHGFTEDQIREMTEGAFDAEAVTPSTLSFGAWRDRPAWAVVLRRRG